jgi:hypothetical protein
VSAAEHGSSSLQKRPLAVPKRRHGLKDELNQRRALALVILSSIEGAHHGDHRLDAQLRGGERVASSNYAVFKGPATL